MTWSADDERKARELLAAATPGPWESSQRGERSGYRYVNNGYQSIAQWCLPHDAALIAAAPTIIAAALEEIGRLSKRFRTEVNHAVCLLRERADAAEARVKALTKDRDHNDALMLAEAEVERLRARVAELGEKVDDLEVVRAAAYAEAGKQTARVATLVAALRQASNALGADEDRWTVKARIDAALGEGAAMSDRDETIRALHCCSWPGPGPCDSRCKAYAETERAYAAGEAAGRAAGAAAEMEACAAIAIARASEWDRADVAGGSKPLLANECEKLAAAIRARGQEPGDE